MVALVVILCVIGVIALLSKFLPNILASIPAVIGLILLVLIVGGVILILSLF